MDDDLLFSSAVALARLVRERAVSPVELVELSLRRIERLDPRLNSVVTVDADAALAAAREAEACAGAPDAPPFLGVPTAVKDLHLTKGLRTTFATAALASFVPEIDDESVARLRRAGFIIVGKTNAPELGTSAVTESELLGPCRNPWDVGRTPGGSSGGAAAAVAAGLVPVAHGSDGAGSIRIPASHCGVFGVKPARGRISNAPLFGDRIAGLSGPGPLSRHVVDAAAMLDVMAGYAAGDPHWAPPPTRPYTEEVAGDPPPLRVGLTTASPSGGFDQACVAVVEDAATLLEGLGHMIEPLDLPIGAQLRVDFELLWASALAAQPLSPETFEPFNTALARRGQEHTAGQLLATVNSLQSQARAIVAASLPFDVILCPTMARPPALVGEFVDLEVDARLDAMAAYVALTPVANITGQPSMSLPLGWTPVDGSDLPLGVMVTGRPADEATLFRLAGQVERAVGWSTRRPPEPA